jgi:hypothetical protein
MPYADGRQEGTSNLQDFLMWAEPINLHVARLSHGFERTKPAFGGIRGFSDYARGFQSTTTSLRKLSGVSFGNSMYWKAADRIGGKVGRGMSSTSLSMIGPSRFLNTWAALSGDMGARSSFNVMSAQGNAVRNIMANNPGMSYAKASQAAFKNAKAYNISSAMGTPLDNQFVSDISAAGPGSPIDRFGRTMDIGTTQAAEFWGRLSTAQKSFKAGTLTAEDSAGVRAAFYKAANLEHMPSFLRQPMVRLMEGPAGVKAGPITQMLGRSIGGVAQFAGGLQIGMMTFSTGVKAGQLAGKATIAAINAPKAIYQNFAQGIHRGTFMSSSPLSPFVGATGRQRAMANIYEKQLNLRQVMGNEAPFLQAQWGF